MRNWVLVSKDPPTKAQVIAATYRVIGYLQLKYLCDCAKKEEKP